MEATFLAGSTPSLLGRESSRLSRLKQMHHIAEPRDRWHHKLWEASLGSKVILTRVMLRSLLGSEMFKYSNEMAEKFKFTNESHCLWKHLLANRATKFLLQVEITPKPCISSTTCIQYTLSSISRTFAYFVHFLVVSIVQVLLISLYLVCIFFSKNYLRLNCLFFRSCMWRLLQLHSKLLLLWEILPMQFWLPKPISRMSMQGPM